METVSMVEIVVELMIRTWRGFKTLLYLFNQLLFDFYLIMFFLHPQLNGYLVKLQVFLRRIPPELVSHRPQNRAP